MGNKATSSIYTLVEKAYLRLQAGDVLTRCLENGSSEPVHELIQEMVVAGPQSLEALREIFGETGKRKSQVYDDLNQVINQLSIILKGYGITFDGQGGNQVLQTLTEAQLMDIIEEEHVDTAEARSGSLLVLKDSQELMATLNAKIQLLESIETYLQDWLWGLTYQHIKQGDNDAGVSSNRHELL